jgi:hypothetical protein
MSVTAAPPSGPVAGGQASPVEESAPAPRQKTKAAPAESGGPKGPEPTRYGDWERNGRCCDF